LRHHHDGGPFPWHDARDRRPVFLPSLDTPHRRGRAQEGPGYYSPRRPVPEMRLPFAVGIVVSGLVGYVVIAWLIRYLERRTFTVFIVYRLALGVVVLLWGLRS